MACAFRPVVFGTRPIETISRSTASTCAPPFASWYSTRTSSSLPFFSMLTPLIFTPSSIFRPCRPKSFAASFATCSSTAPRKAGSASSSVTSAPSRRHTDPISRPMTPAPTTPRRLGHIGDRERTVIGQNPLLVEFDARQRPRVRTGRNDRVTRHQRLIGRTADLDLDAGVAAADERTTAVEERHLVLLEQIQDPVVVLFDHRVLAPEHLREVECETLDLDAVGGELMPGMLVMLGGLQQCLGRNAADVGAGPAGRRPTVLVLPVIDTSRGETQLRRPDRGDIATGPATDDHHVEVLAHFDFRKSRVSIGSE